MIHRRTVSPLAAELLLPYPYGLLDAISGNASLFFFFLDLSFANNEWCHLLTATRLGSSAAKCLDFPALNSTGHINFSSTAVVFLGGNCHTQCAEHGVPLYFLIVNIWSCQAAALQYKL